MEMIAVQRHIFTPKTNYQAFFPRGGELSGGKRLHEEVGRSAMQWPSTNFDLGVLVLSTKSASSQTVEGVPGRVQELNGTSWADRGQGGSNQLGVTGRAGVPARPGVGGSTMFPPLGALLAADVLSALPLSFFLEGRLTVSG